MFYIRQLKTEAEKSWCNDELKKQDDEYDISIESGKWKGLSSGLSEDSEKGGQKSLSISQTGSWRRGMTAQIGTTSSRHKSGSSSLKTPGMKNRKTIPVFFNYFIFFLFNCIY